MYKRGGRRSATQADVNALSGADLTLRRGETLALVGPSGSGKSTLARCLARLENPDSGEIQLHGRDARHLAKDQLAAVRRRIQLVFQHSATAMNPRYSIEDAIGEPLRVAGKLSVKQRREVAHRLMEQVGISPSLADRRPLEFSGGQRQRLAIARALALNPDVLILDEAFAGLDPTTRDQIAEMLLRFQEGSQTSYLFITHDLPMAEQFADAVLYMKNGKVLSPPESAALLARHATPRPPDQRSLKN